MKNIVMHKLLDLGEICFRKYKLAQVISLNIIGLLDGYGIVENCRILNEGNLFLYHILQGVLKLPTQ